MVMEENGLKNLVKTLSHIEQQLCHYVILTKSLIKEYAEKLHLSASDVEYKIRYLVRRSMTKYSGFRLYGNNKVEEIFQRSLNRVSPRIRRRIESMVLQPRDAADRDILKLVVAGEINLVYTTDMYELARKVENIAQLMRPSDITARAVSYRPEEVPLLDELIEDP